MKMPFVRGAAVLAALLVPLAMTPAALAAPTPTPASSPTATPTATGTPQPSAGRTAAAPATPQAAAATVTAVTPDFDDMYSQARAYPPAGVVAEYQPAGQPADVWTPLPRAWTPMPTGVTLQFRWRAEDPTTVIEGQSSWTHTFPGRPAQSVTGGDDFNGPGLSSDWAVSARDTTIGPTKGKGYFRPENVTVADGNLQIKSARHCLPLGADGKPLEEMSLSNQRTEVCPAGTMTTYSVGRIDTNFIMNPPRSMEVRAQMDGANGNHNGITSTAWTHNSQPFCENGVQNSDMVEMDTMEIWKQDRSHNSTHINCRNGSARNIGEKILLDTGKIPGQWRIWRMEFDGYAIRYFLDGEEVLKTMPSRGVTAEIAGMTQEDFNRTVLGYPFKLSIYTTANVNGSWAPWVDDAKPFAPKYDLWDYVRWENFDPKAPGCAPAGEIGRVAAATPELGENWTCERPTEAAPGAQPVGRVQDFAGGRVYWTPQSGAVALVGSVWDKFVSLGGERTLGVPTAQPRTLAGARVQEFSNGMLVSSSSGTLLVKGAIGQKWLEVADAVGAPINEEYCGLRDGGCFQKFEKENSHIYWSSGTGAHFVRGRIFAKYSEMGWENSNIGYPITDEICGIRDGGCFQRFQGESGHIYWSWATDAHFVRGAIFGRYGAMGWENSVFGYPVSDEICGIRDGGCFQRFQYEKGHIYWSIGSGGAWGVQGAIFDHYGRAGWENGRFGYPVGPEECRNLPDARECGQNFQGGRISWSSRYGTSG